MFVMFDESGKATGGRILSEADTTLQLELDSGKRVKVKAMQLLLKFDKPAPAELLKAAEPLAAGFDLDLAWEFAPEGDFSFEALASEYFGGKSLPEQLACWQALNAAPHYFRRAGKGGQFKKAPQEQVQAALAGIEKKKLLAAQIEQWAGELVAGRCPEAMTEQIYKLLFKPDKNSPEYKALVQAALVSKVAPLDLLRQSGAIRSPYAFHWQRFLFDQFPKGVGFPALPPLQAPGDLPLAEGVQAFSIDDSTTTEIDDALSVQGLGSGVVTFGIHIAAPGLALLPGSPHDENVARVRLSTVYMPGWKVTMLPEAWVQQFTLTEGRDCPALSLYLRFDEASLSLLGSETKLERVRVAANLRHDQLDGIITEASLRGEAAADYAFAPELAFAHRLAVHLKAAREQVRGKPENFNRPDYNFKLEGDGGEPQGDETVRISQRTRGTALDLLVAEAMILANSTWGGWLHELGVPGLYRSQASLAPGIKVRMGVKALPHAGMGVAHYAWCTSPLRRYVDLLNQWQLIACLRHGRTAALAAPFKPRDAALFAILSSFDAAYAAYNGFQQQIERYWCLKHLQQSGTTELTASVLRDGLVRVETLPLVFKAVGCDALERGALVRLRVTGIDLLTLELHASLAERLQTQTGPGPETAPESEEDDETPTAAPLTIAVDLTDAEPAPSA
jgi:exoribonuclease II